MVSAPVAAGAPLQAAEVVAKLQGAWKGVAAFEGRFTQTSTGMAFSQPYVQTGTLQIERPLKMRWDYDSPAVRAYLTDGETLWVLDEADRTCTVFTPLDPAFARMANFLTGQGDLEKDYVLSALEPEGVVGPGLKWVPRREDDTFRSIVVRLDPQSGLVSTVTTESAFGDRTETRLLDGRVIADLPDELFRWAPRPGYRVVPGG